jgi:hypothetical protein
VMMKKTVNEYLRIWCSGSGDAKSSIFWDISLWKSGEIQRPFLVLISCLAYFRPKDGVNKFPRNVGWLRRTTQRYSLRISLQNRLDGFDNL